VAFSHAITATYSGFLIGVEESKSNDKDEIQGFFAALRKTSSIPVGNPL
jgi:hypothetical protein